MSEIRVDEFYEAYMQTATAIRFEGVVKIVYHGMLEFPTVDYIWTDDHAHHVMSVTLENSSSRRWLFRPVEDIALYTDMRLTDCGREYLEKNL
jgi:hypothetical protein